MRGWIVPCVRVREILHQQVRSKEHLYVWIEGADDLTQEAQAFQKNLETSSDNVTCILEVREPWKLSPPNPSRCQTITMPSSVSFAKREILNKQRDLDFLFKKKLQDCQSWKDIVSIRKRRRSLRNSSSLYFYVRN
jgi:DNA polymerase III delta prime subunit